MARTFAAILKEHLSSAQILTIIRLNQTDAYKDACATHDFIDANMVMHSAYERVMNKEADLKDDADLELWNKAWEAAKANNFYDESVPRWVAEMTINDPDNGKPIQLNVYKDARGHIFSIDKAALHDRDIFSPFGRWLLVLIDGPSKKEG